MMSYVSLLCVYSKEGVCLDMDEQISYLPKIIKVNCLVLMGIQLLKNLVYLNWLCISMCCIVCVMLIRYQVYLVTNNIAVGSDS